MRLTSSGGPAGSRPVGTDPFLSVILLEKHALICPSFRKQSELKWFAQTTKFRCIRWRTTIKNSEYTASSVALLSVEDEDSYVPFYIQLQNTWIAYETLLSLQLLEPRENGRQRTTGWGWEYANTGQSVSGCGRGLSSMISYCSEIKKGLIIETI